MLIETFFAPPKSALALTRKPDNARPLSVPQIWVLRMVDAKSNLRANNGAGNRMHQMDRILADRKPLTKSGPSTVARRGQPKGKEGEVSESTPRPWFQVRKWCIRSPRYPFRCGPYLVRSWSAEGFPGGFRCPLLSKEKDHKRTSRTAPNADRAGDRGLSSLIGLLSRGSWVQVPPGTPYLSLS